MCAGFFTRLIRLIKGEEVRPFEESVKTSKIRLGSWNGYSYDYDFLINTLESCKDKKTFKELCEKYDIKNPDGTIKDPNPNDRNKTTYALMLNLHRILYKLTYFDDEHFYNQIDSEIDNWKEIRIKEYEQSGKLCPKCGLGPYEEHHSGLVEITYDYTAGGPVGAGVHVSGTGKQEYQFHYKKCDNCGHWKMYQWRETPSWWDDLWNLDCPFTKGDIIEDFVNGKVSSKKYKSHNITRW